jgi:hypothetical protein
VSSDTVALRCHTHCPVSYQNKSLGSAAETSFQSWSWQNATASSIEFPSRNPRQLMDAPRALAAFPDPQAKTAVHPPLPTRWNATNRRCFPIVRCPKRVLAKSAQLESLPPMNLARHCREAAVCVCVRYSTHRTQRKLRHVVLHSGRCGAAARPACSSGLQFPVTAGCAERVTVSHLGQFQFRPKRHRQ